MCWQVIRLLLGNNFSQIYSQKIHLVSSGNWSWDLLVYKPTCCLCAIVPLYGFQASRSIILIKFKLTFILSRSTYSCKMFWLLSLFEYLQHHNWYFGQGSQRIRTVQQFQLLISIICTDMPEMLKNKCQLIFALANGKAVFIESLWNLFKLTG